MILFHPVFTTTPNKCDRLREPAGAAYLSAHYTLSVFVPLSVMCNSPGAADRIGMTHHSVASYAISIKVLVLKMYSENCAFVLAMFNFVLNLWAFNILKVFI